MTIPEDPHKLLLDDEGATAFVSEHLQTWTNLLRDLTNYGSHLIPRAYSSSGKTLSDMVLIGTLLRQLVAMIDAIEILLCRSAVHASTLQLRAMFEASVYIDWMLASDRENKAAYYYVHNLLRLRLWAMRVEGKSHVNEIDRVLAQSRFAAIRDDFRDWKKGNDHRPNWYSPLGVPDLRDMAIKVNQEPFYVFVYGPGSEVMHTSNYGHHVRVGSGRITFLSIRHPKGFSTTVRLTATIAIDIFMKILKEYREGECARFGQKYIEKWQQAFRSIPELKINESEMGS
jgi:hypothetical protein